MRRRPARAGSRPLMESRKERQSGIPTWWTPIVAIHIREFRPSAKMLARQPFTGKSLLYAYPACAFDRSLRLQVKGVPARYYLSRREDVRPPTRASSRTFALGHVSYAA